MERAKPLETCLFECGKCRWKVKNYYWPVTLVRFCCWVSTITYALHRTQLRSSVMFPASENLLSHCSLILKKKDNGDEPPHQICSYTLLFLLFLHFLYIANPPLCTSALTRLHRIALALAWQLHSLHQTDLAYLMDIWLTIHMYLLLFLVSPTCPLLQSDQSWALTLCG